MTHDPSPAARGAAGATAAASREAPADSKGATAAARASDAIAEEVEAVSVEVEEEAVAAAGEAILNATTVERRAISPESVPTRRKKGAVDMAVAEMAAAEDSAVVKTPEHVTFVEKLVILLETAPIKTTPNMLTREEEIDLEEIKVEEEADLVGETEMALMTVMAVEVEAVTASSATGVARKATWPGTAH